MTNGTFNPAALSGTVYGIAGAGISLGLLAGMARGISDMTWGQRPTVRATKKSQDKRKQQPRMRPYKPIQFKPYRPKPAFDW